MHTVIVLALSYLTGCIPSAYVAGRLLGGVDIRQLGDGNMGARNVFVHLSRSAGVLVAILDAAKGAAAVLLVREAGLSTSVAVLAGLGAIAGHDWPVFLRFRGGAGASTALGASLMLMPREIVLAVFIAGSVVIATRQAVLFSPLAFGLPLALGWWLQQSPALLLGYAALPLLIGVRAYQRAYAERRPPVLQPEQE